MMIKTTLSCIFLFTSIINLAQTSSSITYEESTQVIPNPERGFYHHTEVHSNTYTFLNEETLVNYRTNESITQILRVFYLESFRERPISQEYLDNMQTDFRTARSAGIKVIVRFAYTKGTSQPYGDATPEVVFMHIKQLQNVLRVNADVIAVVQAGFIGAWGEWYYTDDFAGYTPSDIKEEHWADRKRVLAELLTALPKDRMIQIRTPGYKMRMYDSENPLSDEEAFSGSDIARIGHHNDCFVASSSDVGTYTDPDVEKPYLTQETKYLPMGGETCGLSSPYSDCPNSTSELERFHWSYLNIDYHGSVLDEWDNQGCFDEIERRLGYRFVLESGSVTTETTPSGIFNLSVNIKNHGYSSPYNPRKVELVLKNTTTSNEYILKLGEDPRMWPVNSSFMVQVEAGLPTNMVEGTYRAFLNLPDPYSTVENDPAYSIQFANSNTWNDVLGYNDLGVDISVSQGNNSEVYNGDFIFRDRTDKELFSAPREIFGGSGDTENLIFWSAIENASRIVERSLDGVSFEVIATLPGNIHFVRDTDVAQNQTYWYRYKLVNSDSESTYSNAVSITTQSDDQTEIIIDGSDEEWNHIKPIGSETYNDTTSYVIRSYWDIARANFIIYGPLAQYEIYLNTNDSTDGWGSDDMLRGMDYLIRNDSLFELVGNEIAYSGETITSANQTDMYELSIPLQLFDNLELNPIIGFVGIIDQKLLISDSDSSSISFFRLPPPDLPATIEVIGSTSFRERLELNWSLCAFCDGYIIERSEEGTNFSEIADLDFTSTKLFDANLTTGDEYFYRIRTYNKLGNSEFSNPVIGVPGRSVLSLPNYEKLLLYPNPAKTILWTNIDLEWVIIYGLTGQIIPNIEYQNRKIDVSNLAPGVYLLDGVYSGGIVKEVFIKQ